MYILITHFISKSRLVLSRTLLQVTNVVTFLAGYSQMLGLNCLKLRGEKT